MCVAMICPWHPNYPIWKWQALDVSPYSFNSGVVSFMGNLAEKFMKSRWIPFIFHWDVIQEELHNVCVWNATILLMIFVVSYFIIALIGRWPNLWRRQVFLKTPFPHYFPYGSIWKPPNRNSVSSSGSDSKICTFKVTFPMGSVALFKLTSHFTGKSAKI
jgi:hypothetical protein